MRELNPFIEESASGRFKQWKSDREERLRYMHDEPWYNDSKKCMSVLSDMADIFRCILGEDNCVFEDFDLMHALGILYYNAKTNRRHAVRVRYDANASEIMDAICQLKARTNV